MTAERAIVRPTHRRSAARKSNKKRKNPDWWPEQSGKKKAVNYAATEAGEQQIQKGLCE